MGEDNELNLNTLGSVNGGRDEVYSDGYIFRFY